MTSLDELVLEIRQCRQCESALPLGPRPILAASPSSRVLVVGQAPGRKVHQTGVPWDDASGKRLRDWMGVSAEDFYDDRKIALVPMGFCYPGTGKSGDLPPRRECAEHWHHRLLAELKRVELTIVIGHYAQAYFLGPSRKPTLTATVAAWEEYGPRLLPLPHPSPRNNRWLKTNAWFERDVLPRLKQRIVELLDEGS